MANYRIGQSCKLDANLHRDLKQAAFAKKMTLEAALDEAVSFWLRRKQKILKQNAGPK